MDTTFKLSVLFDQNEKLIKGVGYEIDSLKITDLYSNNVKADKDKIIDKDNEPYFDFCSRVVHDGFYSSGPIYNDPSANGYYVGSVTTGSRTIYRILNGVYQTETQFWNGENWIIESHGQGIIRDNYLIQNDGSAIGEIINGRLRTIYFDWHNKIK